MLIVKPAKLSVSKVVAINDTTADLKVVDIDDSYVKIIHVISDSLDLKSNVCKLTISKL